MNLEETEYSSLISDFSLTEGYKSYAANNENNITHLFIDYKNLELQNTHQVILNLKLKE